MLHTLFGQLIWFIPDHLCIIVTPFAYISCPLSEQSEGHFVLFLVLSFFPGLTHRCLLVIRFITLPLPLSSLILSSSILSFLFSLSALRTFLLDLSIIRLNFSWSEQEIGGLLRLLSNWLSIHEYVSDFEKFRIEQLHSCDNQLSIGPCLRNRKVDVLEICEYLTVEEQLSVDTWERQKSDSPPPFVTEFRNSYSNFPSLSFPYK